MANCICGGTGVIGGFPGPEPCVCQSPNYTIRKVQAVLTTSDLEEIRRIIREEIDTALNENGLKKSPEICHVCGKEKIEGVVHRECASRLLYPVLSS